ncbi:MAG: alkaline phosphatase [Synergistaceae bacterium]|nr:alkaline phosphatase [Synergistaceae bacterium]
MRIGTCKKIYARYALIAFFAVLAFCSPGAAEARAKYVFLFIGDGMGSAQRNAAELYLAGKRAHEGDLSERESQLIMNSMPANGFIRTGSMSGVTDSAAAGTALATGHKTQNGAVAMDPKSGEKYASMAYAARGLGMKVGIVTSAFVQDATPAVFYGHAPKRSDHYSLGKQLTESGFEYFGGGGFINPSGRGKKSRDLYDIAASKGYRIVKELGERAAGKVMAVHPKLSGGYMPWAIGRSAGPSLADFVDYGIGLLDGDQGFFMMVEGGRIDLACHANDAAAAIHEVIDFDEAVACAVRFLQKRPESTLIVVTSDHETGGMALDASRTAEVGLYRALLARQEAYSAFERKISPTPGAKLGAYVEMARKFFGSSVAETPAVQRAFRLSMTDRKKRAASEPEYKKLYGPYDPFTMACMKEADAAAGITWTTYYHTGKNVPVSAMGVGEAAFSGEFENTEIFDKIIAAMTPD